jgi:hypothetical protein
LYTPLVLTALVDKIRDKNFDRWLTGYARHLVTSRRPVPANGPRHLLFALCDHYEPLWGGADEPTGLKRVETWLERYPALAERYRDADGRPPQHSFFFPGEEYRPSFFDALDQLVRRGYGEVELHLHHDDDTPERMRASIESYLAIFAERGHFSRTDGKPRYAFIHGNWALANARPDGRLCGVDAELPLLFETGCYADYTFPSVPDVSQPNIVNQIYWPTGDLARRRAYEEGEQARVGSSRADRILMIQGPLAIALREKRLAPRIEYGALTAHDPPSTSRVKSWAAQNIHVAGRPEWVFVKVYTHGAPEAQAASLLGDGGRALHDALTQHFNDGARWKLHYVTAREMYNIAMAAMAGKAGDPVDHRDHLLPPPPIRDGQGTKT